MATFTVPTTAAYTDPSGGRYQYQQGAVVPLEHAVKLRMPGAAAALNATIATQHVPPLSDTFNRAATTAGLGFATSGHKWQNDLNAKISRGMAVPSFAGNGSVYALIDMGRPVVRQAMTFRLGNPAMGLTMICGNGLYGYLTEGGAFNDMSHLVTGATGFNHTIWQRGAEVSEPIPGLVESLLTNGTEYAAAVTYDTEFSRTVIERPSGGIFAVAVPGLADVHGQYIIYQIRGETGQDHTFGLTGVSAQCDPVDAAATNLITNPYALTDLTAITINGGATHSRQVGDSPGGTTFVRVVCSGVSAFQGVIFAGAVTPTPDDGPPVTGALHIRGVVGGENVDVYTRIHYTDASTDQNLTNVTLTTAWQRVSPLPRGANAAKTVQTVSMAVFQDGSVPNPAISFDVTGATVAPAVMVL